MPLRDHFHSPLNDRRSWDELHGMWPGVIATMLNRHMPTGYAASPMVHLGKLAEVDVAAFEEPFDEPRRKRPPVDPWSPSAATVLVAKRTRLPDEYAVEIRELKRGRKLVASIEIVSPSNKSKLENRRKFLHKCDSLLRAGVCVTIVDVVTSRKANFYRSLLHDFRKAPNGPATDGPIYAATLRATVGTDRTTTTEAWAEPLAVGDALPTLPVWVNATTAIPLELEARDRQSLETLLFE